MVAVLQPGFETRPMRRADIEAVWEIEQRSYPFPWTRGIFFDCLRIGYCCRIAEVDGGIGGYTILSAAAGEAHLLNLCIAPDHRRCGLGQLMLEGAMVDARLRSAHRLFLEVRPSNRGAVGLYAKNDFRIIGRRPGYYPAGDGREDALVMVRHLDDAD